MVSSPICLFHTMAFIIILLWQRMKGCWINEKVITELQGACRPCQLCKHMAFSFQETIAASIEDNNKCLVAFFDGAKAFDTMSMEGLFKQMYIHLVSKERHCGYCIDDILMLIVRIYREMFQTDISTPHLMVCNGSWHLTGNPKMVWHPAHQGYIRICLSIPCI